MLCVIITMYICFWIGGVDLLGNGKTLGVLGGLGPMSSVYFYEMLTAHTAASCDQEHLNILRSGRYTPFPQLQIRLNTRPRL